MAGSSNDSFKDQVRPLPPAPEDPRGFEKGLRDGGREVGRRDGTAPQDKMSGKGQAKGKQSSSSAGSSNDHMLQMARDLTRSMRNHVGMDNVFVMDADGMISSVAEKLTKEEEEKHKKKSKNQKRKERMAKKQQEENEEEDISELAKLLMDMMEDGAGGGRQGEPGVGEAAAGHGGGAPASGAAGAAPQQDADEAWGNFESHPVAAYQVLSLIQTILESELPSVATSLGLDLLPEQDGHHGVGAGWGARVRTASPELETSVPAVPHGELRDR
jgi:hypothetical protein